MISNGCRPASNPSTLCGGARRLGPMGDHKKQSHHFARVATTLIGHQICQQGPLLPRLRQETHEGHRLIGHRPHVPAEEPVTEGVVHDAEDIRVHGLDEARRHPIEPGPALAYLRCGDLVPPCL